MTPRAPEIDIVLQPAARCVLRVQLPGAGLADARAVYSVRAADGTPAHRWRARMVEDERTELHLCLAPGAWHLDIAVNDGRRFTGAFHVTSLAPALAIDVELEAVR